MPIDFSTLSQQRLLAERVKNALSKIEDKTDLLYTITTALDTYVDGVNDKVDGLSIPTKTSELTNDAKFQNDTEVAAAIANSDKLVRKKIDSLSDIDLTADDADKYIYMLPVTNSDGDTYYQQYMIIDGVAEAIGTTKIDLEGYLTDNDVATDAEVDEGIEEGLDFSTFSMPICVNKNLFRNGTLLKPVNQRGKDSYTGIGYGFDGWYAYHADTTVTKSNEGLVVTNSVNSLNAVVSQIIPTSDLILGEYTLSALSTGGFNNIEVWSGSRKLLEAPSDKFFSKKINIDSTWTHSQIRFNFYMKPESKFVGAKLERGDRQTAVYKDISGAYVWIECPDETVELLRCCSWFFEARPQSPYGRYGVGLLSNGNKVNLQIPLMTPLRSIPTLSYRPNIILYDGKNRLSVSTISLDVLSTLTCSVWVIADSTSTIGEIGKVYLITDSGLKDSWIRLSAELLPA